MLKGHRKLRLTFFTVILYFSILLVPKAYPALGGTKFFYLYFLTVLFLAPVIMGGVALWGLIGIVISLIQKKRIRTNYRAAVIFAFATACAFVSILILLKGLPSRLPSGSDMMKFDPEAWKSPESLVYVDNEITIRQKMLKDVVDILPGKTKDEIENLLGPSLETQYFQSNGRDMIYVLGRERDAFLGIDSEWLCIWLDANGKFLKYRITAD